MREHAAVWAGRRVVMILAGAALAVAPGLAGQEGEAFRLTGDRVSVYNLAGTAEIVPHGGPDVRVEVRRRGGDGDRLTVEVDEIGGREALRVRYPSDRVVYADLRGRTRTRVGVSEDGTFFDDRGGWGGERVEISTGGRGLEAWADLRILVPEGRDVAFYLAVGRTRVEGVDARLRVETGSGGIETLSTRGRLVLDTGSGSVSVRDAEGDVFVDTGSGSVEVFDVRGAELVVDTGSGRVRGGGIRTRRVRVDTGSGGIELADVAASDLYLDTGSGSVQAELTTDADEVVIDTGSGSVELRVPESLGARIEVDTGSGGIDVEVPLEIRRAERDHLEGTLGDGRGRIRLDTGSGSVRILPR